MTSPFGCDFSIDDVTFKAPSGATIPDKTLDEVVGQFNEYGFVILQFEPRPEPRENLLALTPFFGRVVPHDRSDRCGILSVNAENPTPGFIDSSHKTHPPHTDGAFKDDPERIVALQCVIPAESGGTSLLGSGKYAHAELARTAVSDLDELYDPAAISIQRNERGSTKAIFRVEDGRVAMCFRMDDTATIDVKPSARQGFQALREVLQQSLFRFDLKPHQILIIDNLSMVHGRDAFPEGSSRHYNRLNFDGDGLLDLECGFYSDFEASHGSMPRPRSGENNSLNLGL